MKIKGHMTVELTDVKTGEVEIHEDDNLVTNGVKEFFGNGGVMNPTMFVGTTDGIISLTKENLLKMLFGGLLLYDTTLTAQASNIWGDAGIKMTGNGVNGVTSNDTVTEFGSYNSQESGYQEDGSYKQVWDFTTTQANGTIASACLCPIAHGQSGDGNATSHARKTSTVAPVNDDLFYYGYGNANKQLCLSGENNSANNWLLWIDAEHNEAVIGGFTTKTQAFYVRKVPFTWNTFDIRDTWESTRFLSESTQVTIPSGVPNNYNVFMERSFLGHDSSGACYFAISDSSSYLSMTASKPLIVLKLVRNNDSTYTMTKEIDLYPSTFGKTGTQYLSNANSIVVCNDALFMTVNSSNNSVGDAYKMALDSNHTLQTVTNNVSTTLAALVTVIPERNIILYATQVVDLENREINPLNAYDYNCPLYSLLSVDGVFKQAPKGGADVAYAMKAPRRCHWFLSTINNLESPVVKTADKTMKITYVLRFVD